MEPEASGNFLLWVIPLFPLAGFLLNAFLGAGWTKSPRPVVEEGEQDEHHAIPAAPTTSAVAHNSESSDTPEFDANPGVTAAGTTPAGQHPAHDDHGDHGHGHGDVHDVHLDAGGTRLVGTIATVMVALSFVVSLIIFLQVLGLTGEERRIFSSAFTWMRVPEMAGLPGLDLNFRLAVDPLTALMLLIVTGVGALIHLYSTGYMSHDKGYARYFTYLNLFIFFMLLLIMGSNFLVMFVGWEGVGLASYLLIGFFYERKSAGDAAKKAFIVNRVGDFAFLIALFLIFQNFGTFEFFGENGVLTRAALGDWPAGYIGAGLGAISSLVPLLMFIGATGKSAQIPLYVWLPDAMEGPTPVSALIHAATMVTAGVFMVCRTHLLFLQAPEVMTIVAVIGVTTAFLAATIGMVQYDIKKVLAYSTVSQLGYMFLACGVGAFGAAMFHVMTHAFFKALLFLGSGSVIHAMGGEQDMRKMGGLASRIRTTYLTMFIGTLAIAGIPFLAGFFSKDEILLNAYAGPEFGGLGSPWLWTVGFIVAGMTPFYMWRMMGKTFTGELRAPKEVADHIHESPPSMLWPLRILAGLSIVGGFLNPSALAVFGVHGPWPLDGFLGESVEWRAVVNKPLEVAHGTELLLVVVSSLLAVVISLWAWNQYKRSANGEYISEASKQHNQLWRTVYNKWGVDDVYNSLFVARGKRLATWLWRFVDVRIVDGTVNGLGGAVAGLGQLFRGSQSGYVRNYALSMLVGVVIVIVGCLYGMTVALR